jgi:hypothetical protein
MANEEFKQPFPFLLAMMTVHRSQYGCGLRADEQFDMDHQRRGNRTSTDKQWASTASGSL